MIGITKLVTDRTGPSDRLRYGVKGKTPDHHTFESEGKYHPVVVWNITESCNLACKHCYYSAVLGRKPITIPFDEVTQVIDQLAEEKVPVLLLSGGEPLIRPDILDIASHAAEKGMRPVFSTNGTLIRKPEYARRMADHGANYVGISIDGSESSHDDFRQRRGSYAKSIKAIETCIEAGLRVSIRFTVTEANADDLDGVLDLAGELGVDRFCLYHLVPTGRARRDGDISQPRRRRIVEQLCERAERETYEILTVDNPADGPLAWFWAKKHRPDRADDIKAKLISQRGDGTGRRIVEIDHNGDVHPNQFWLDTTLGNVRKQSFRSIWNPENKEDAHPLLQDLRRTSWPLEGRCGECTLKSVCGGFRARARNMTGSHWGEDPSCPLTSEEIRTEFVVTQKTEVTA